MSKRKQYAAEKRARRERKRKFMTVFINGKQKRVPRPPSIDGLSVERLGYSRWLSMLVKLELTSDSKTQ